MNKIDEKSEELLEAMWIALEDETCARGVSSLRIPLAKLPDDPDSFARLTKHGLVEMLGEEHVGLTALGEQAAESLVRRHRLAERLVYDVLDLHGEIMDEYACHFEHLVHQGLEERICTLLGHPRLCPHGKRIPPGDCCSTDRHNCGPIVRTLVELHPGEEGTIAYLHAADQNHLNKLLAMGVLPGSKIQLKRRLPTFVFQLGFSQFAVDQEIASGIYVRVET